MIYGRSNPMKCRRSGGSTIEVEKGHYFGLNRMVRKCISCAHEQEKEVKEVGTTGLTEDEKEAKRAYHREWRKNNSPDAKLRGCKKHPGVKAVIGKNGRSTGCCMECLANRARKAGKTRVKTPKERSLPERVIPDSPIVAEGDGNLFIAAGAIGNARQELRFELVYKLVGINVIPEGRG